MFTSILLLVDEQCIGGENRQIYFSPQCSTMFMASGLSHSSHSVDYFLFYRTAEISPSSVL